MPFRCLIMGLALLLAACDSPKITMTVDKTSWNTLRLSLEGDLKCGEAGVEDAANRKAAIETINRCWENYRLDGDVGLDGRRYVGTYKVELFKEDDPRGTNSHSARSVLGSKWKSIVKDDSPPDC